MAGGTCLELRHLAGEWDEVTSALGLGVVKESSLHMWLSCQLFIYFCLQLLAQPRKTGHEGRSSYLSCSLTAMRRPQAHHSGVLMLKAAPWLETHGAKECLWIRKGDKPPKGAGYVCVGGEVGILGTSLRWGGQKWSINLAPTVFLVLC